jgi:hypothetical protein
LSENRCNVLDQGLLSPLPGDFVESTIVHFGPRKAGKQVGGLAPGLLLEPAVLTF